MSVISNSYPFLSISRKYGVPYGAVLWQAQVRELGPAERSERHINFMLAVEHSFEVNASGTKKMEEYQLDLDRAVVHVLQVKNGLVDAYTGERINP